MSMTKQALSYAFLPGIIPRVKNLFRGSFGYTAFLLAQIFFAARLIAPTHPYLNHENIGRFGLRHVIAEAANNLVISFKNLDQILIFLTLVTGIVLLMVQFLLFGLSVVTQPNLAMAQDDPPQQSQQQEEDFSKNPIPPDQDIAFIILDRVFGLKGVYNSCISTDAICQDIHGNNIEPAHQYPTGFQIALHKLLGFYSMGVFYIAVLIILYYIIAITAETAATGSPFGQRVNKAWVLPRLIIFAALLIPLNMIGGEAEESDLSQAGKPGISGINTAQYITFLVAKAGSNFATEGWKLFTEDLKGAPVSQAKKLYASTNVPQVDTLAQFLYTAQACMIAENTTRWLKDDSKIEAYVAHPASFQSGGQRELFIKLEETNYMDAWERSHYGPIRILFGRHDPEKYKDYSSHIMPRCGELHIGAGSLDEAVNVLSPGTKIHEAYFKLVQENLKDAKLAKHLECFLINDNPQIRERMSQDCSNVDLSAEFITNYTAKMDSSIETAVENVLDQMNNNPEEWKLEKALLKKGWGGAGLWYNKIAELNGKLTTAVFNIPEPVMQPIIMEQVARQRIGDLEGGSIEDRYNPRFDTENVADLPGVYDFNIAVSLHKAYRYWNDSEVTQSRIDRYKNNFLIRGINMVFGSHGLFNIRQNEGVHPMAQLSAMGKSLMHATIRNLIGGMSGQLLSNLTGIGGASQALQTIFKSIAGLGQAFLALGFVMYYMLPFLPFMYFFFALANWIGSIFEAVVAMPLWALAHVRIDGNGLPGQAAADGYFLLFEIFLRPILILFGLISSIVLFSTMVDILNDVFELVAYNMLGFQYLKEAGDLSAAEMNFYRAPIDEFFLSIIYTVLVYLIGTSNFKMIDLIPNQIMRWSGFGKKSFAELGAGASGTAEQAMSSTYRGGKIMTNQLSGGQLAALM